MNKIFLRNKKKFVILILLIFVTLETAYMIFYSISPQRQNVLGANLYTVEKEYFIELRKDGFYPRELTIHKQDTVTFTTAQNKSFWPASNLHPSHTIYPEFDPKEPVTPAGGWSFRFDRVGEWRYHDHLAPLFKGVIIVREQDPSIPHYAQESCGDIGELAQKIVCWSGTIESTVQIDSVRAAFDVFRKLYNEEADFAENCHGFTHIIGEEAYKKFGAEENLKLTSQIGYCSYGFFHGFVEAMMHEKGSLAGARDFCMYIDRHLSEELYTLGPCFHGIGHGVTDASDPRSRGNEAALVEEGLRLCQEVGHTEFETKLCATGVFNSLAIMYLRPQQYNLDFNQDDPYRFCREVSNPLFKEACYEDFKILPLHIAHEDFPTAAHFVEEITEDRYAFAAMDSVSTYAIYYMLRDAKLTDDAIRTCYTLQERLWPSCIAGLGAGLMSSGIPDKEYIRALELCRSSLVQEKERTMCFARVVRLIGLRYSQETYQAICGTLEEKYRKYCVEVS